VYFLLVKRAFGVSLARMKGVKRTNSRDFPLPPMGFCCSERKIRFLEFENRLYKSMEATQGEAKPQPQPEEKDYVPHSGTLDLFSRYSGISDQQEVIERAKRIREKALQAYPYHCIKEFYFMDTRVAQHPFYKELLAREDRTQRKVVRTFSSLNLIFKTRYWISAVVWELIFE